MATPRQYVVMVATSAITTLITGSLLGLWLTPLDGESGRHPTEEPVLDLPSCGADTTWPLKWPMCPLTPGFFNFKADYCSSSAERRLAEVVVPVCDRVWRYDEDASEDEDGSAQQEGGLIVPSDVKERRGAPSVASRFRPIGRARGSVSSATGWHKTATLHFVWHWYPIFFCWVGCLFVSGMKPGAQIALQGLQSQGVDIVEASGQSRALLRMRNVIVQWLRAIALAVTSRMCRLAPEIDSVRLQASSRGTGIVLRRNGAALDRSEVAAGDAQSASNDAALVIFAFVVGLRAGWLVNRDMLQAALREIAELRISKTASEAKTAELKAGMRAWIVEMKRFNIQMYQLQDSLLAVIQHVSDTCVSAESRQGELRKELEQARAEHSACHARVSEQEALIAQLNGEVAQAMKGAEPAGAMANANVTSLPAAGGRGEDGLCEHFRCVVRDPPTKVALVVAQTEDEALSGESGAASGKKRTRRAGALVSWHRQWLQAIRSVDPTWMPFLREDGMLPAVDGPPSLQALYSVPGVTKGPAPVLTRPLADIPELPPSVTSTPTEKLAVERPARCRSCKRKLRLVP